MAKVTELPLTIPKGMTRQQRLKIADLAIEFIVERTQGGVDKNGKRFPKYSKAYIESLDFKNAGKSPGKVDLQLSGDMLAAMSLLKEKDGQIVIGIDPKSEEAGRAEGNILGSYGGEPNKKRARDFLGIKKENLQKIIDLVVSET